MFYVYVLRSLKDGKHYIGFTTDVERRVAWHNDGKNTSTKHRAPFVLVYREAFEDKKAAMRREKQIKSYKGGNQFKKLISDYFTQSGGVA